MRSMTGFGHSEISGAEFEISVDLKSVNSRYFDLKARLPIEFSLFENDLRSQLQKMIERGRVELFVDFRSRARSQLELNEPLVRDYLELDRVLESFGVSGHLTASELLQLDGVVQKRTRKQVNDEVKEALFEVVDQASGQLVEARTKEGQVLQVELEERLESLGGYVSRIEEFSKKIAASQRGRLENRLREFQENSVVDEARMVQEVLYYVERADISEEITRLRSHISRFKEYIAQSSDGAVGKKLDFLCQELNRETNTILSKAGKVEISEIGVESKSEIERIREQVQNVE